MPCGGQKDKRRRKTRIFSVCAPPQLKNGKDPKTHHIFGKKLAEK